MYDVLREIGRIISPLYGINTQATFEVDWKFPIYLVLAWPLLVISRFALILYLGVIILLGGKASYEITGDE